MILTSLTVVRDTTTGRSLRFSASCREIRVVKNETINIPNSVASASAASKAKLGKKAQEAITEDNKTFAKSIFDGVRNAFGKGA